LAGVLDLAQLNITLALLDGVTNQLGRAGLTLGADNEGLLLLAGLVDNEGGTLGVLLGNLLGFNGSGELGGEGQVLDSEVAVSAGRSFNRKETMCIPSRKHHQERC
jgi:hypothetical protein